MKRSHIVAKDTSRRDILKLAGGCAALTNTSLLSTMLNLSATNTAVAQTSGLSGYKALVCVFLFGGNDSFNMLTPLTSSEHADYLAARGGDYTAGNGALGIPASELAATAITDSVSGRQFGIHPSMPEVKTLFDQGKATFLANVGSLVEPTTMAQYQSRANLPLGLFSHSDLQQHWMTSVPQSRSQVTGWAGRMADMITDTVNTNPAISMNMSLDSVNLLQTGGSVVPYVVTSNGAQEVGWYGPTWTQAKIFTTLTDDVLSRSYANLMEKTFAKMNRTALDAAISFNDAVDQITTVDQFFPTSPSRLQSQLRMIAKSIGAHESIGQSRQIFFVGVGGWDNHDNLIGAQDTNLATVSQALKSFQDSIDELNMTNDVVTFTASDFGRTLSSNGKGSDHAWGGNQIVMGGPVTGGRIHGDYPLSLASGNALDLGRGRLLPTTSVDQMAAELAMWYGVANDNNMEHILPNIRNFFGAGTSYPIGFLS
ncbi:DUF1501 domain-containing protein [Rubripirellula reticaptiva]|uniref:DUF1501 domain-containing protein n=1 Tax=Rubripirellula reticaptiva TaxID=2528013 RepID=A0A5C6F9U2_9BACT|nr:DUF1501 domain-containing protein [Rubripirellula reticaptiva]TWU57320.1 hypothetical protein Poly59_02270 [Rubripirellula reticaptiva]